MELKSNNLIILIRIHLLGNNMIMQFSLRAKLCVSSQYIIWTILQFD